MQLSANNLVCHRGGRTVFSGLSFTVAQGEGLLLEGPNGTGKTSLLRILAGFGAIEQGALELKGADEELTIGQRAHYLGHQNALKLALSVEENLTFWANFMGQSVSSSTIADHLGAFNLESLSSYSAGLLSAGQKRRLALSRLELVSRPIWLLDEPSVGLDTASCALLADAMSRHMAAGGLLIASTHTDLGLTFKNKVNLGDLGGRAT
ncbi:MAG: heme ABC exporter ATP-binding protein CcmA [Alphaproteobacteria bacterium]|nr:heme ABC exporter ATP-binding protein CcmA [Alphaproteobacteria bacterium]